MAWLFNETSELSQQRFPQCILFNIYTVIGNYAMTLHYLFTLLEVVLMFAIKTHHFLDIENLLDFWQGLEGLEEIRLLLLETLVFLTGDEVKSFLGMNSAICQNRNIERTVAAGKREYKCRSFLFVAFHSEFINTHRLLTGFKVEVGCVPLRFDYWREN